MADTIQITDGTTTIDLLDSSAGYCALDRGWSPKVAQRNTTGIGGKPYLPVQEDITIKVTGATAVIVHQRLNALANLIDQAGRWYDGENVDAVLFQYQPAGSATTYSTTIQRDAAALLGLPSTFADAELYVGADGVTMTDVTLSFVRDGLWYGGEESGYANLVANGDFETTTSPWTAINGTLSLSSAQSYTGAKSLLNTASAANAYVITPSGSRYPVTAGENYTASCWMRANSNVTVNIRILWYTAVTGGSFISEVFGSQISCNGEWKQATLSGTAPATAVAADIRILDTRLSSIPSASGNLFYADDVRFYATDSTVTSVGNPAVLEMTFDESAAVPSPVDFELSHDAVTSISTAQMAVAISNNADKIFLNDAAQTTTTATATDSHDYDIRALNTRRVAVFAVVRGQDWTLQLEAVATDSYVGVKGAITTVNWADYQFVSLGTVSLYADFAALRIRITRLAATSNLVIGGVMAVAVDDGNTRVVTSDDPFYELADKIYFIQNALARPKPTIYSEDTGYNTGEGIGTGIIYTPWQGIFDTYLSGDTLAVGIMGRSGSVADIRDGSPAELDFTLQNVTRRRAYLIPE